MTMRTLASKIAKREGKKHQASVGDIREILKILVTIVAEEEEQDEAGTFALLAGEALKVKAKNAKKKGAK